MFEVVEFHGAAPGPTVALIGGIHGDEDEGVLAVQRVSALLNISTLVSGTLRAVAVAHPAAYAANRRASPLDGLNLARCFPGSATGSATERLAHDLTEGIIRDCDFLIDLHSAGRDYAMPTFVGYFDTGDYIAARSRRAAEAFGAPLLWEHTPPVPPGRTLSIALELGVPCIYVEGSGGGSLGFGELEMYVNGVLHVLGDLDMLSPSPNRTAPERIIRGGGGNIDAGLTATCSGRFVARRQAGDVLQISEVVGEIVDEAGRTVATLAAPEEVTLILLRRAARIADGDILCAFAAPAMPWRPQAGT